MQALLYHRKLDLSSGTAQLMRMQVAGLRAAGVATTLACQHGALRFFLRTGMRVRRTSAAALARARDRAEVLVDHGLEIPTADVVFVHNLHSRSNLYLGRADLVAKAAAERTFFASLASDVPVVANSGLVRQALQEHFALEPARIIVHHPGYQAARFRAERRSELRDAARRELRIDDSTPLIGFVTSGDFQKRGLDLFLECAERISDARRDAHFFVVGSRRLPESAARHPLLTLGKLSYRPKNHQPERWMAALDVFLYPARFEEFGMVVLEAAALGVPIVTSRRVGASECLPADYQPWLSAAPDSELLAAHALRLLDDTATRTRLAARAAEHARAFDDRAYAAATAVTIMAQNRRLK
jgi:glycosyltransferase involved in cell wall biosynthesis